MTKSFKFTELNIKPNKMKRMKVWQKITLASSETYYRFHGNFKINSMVKMLRLFGDRKIDWFVCTRKQYEQYYFLLWNKMPKDYNTILSWRGIKFTIDETSL